MSELAELRRLPPLPGVHAAPSELVEYLLDVRRRQDRVEELLGRSMRHKVATQRTLDEAKTAAEEEWDRVAVANKNANDYTSAKERAAEANLATLDLRRQVRKAEDALAVANELVEQLRLAHRGLDSTRQDIHTILRALSFESSLER